MNHSARSRKGFTLVEIMIVVIIIGMLTAIAIPAFTKVRKTTQNNAVLNNLRQISAAAQQYFMENAVSQVNWTDLVGYNSNNYVHPISPVAKENYSAAFSVITSSLTEYSISAPALGTTIVVYMQ